MAGRYLTQEEMWRICRAAAEKAAAAHGIKDIDGFTQALMQVSWAESAGPTAEDGWYTWDSQSVHDQGQGFGLFALHDRGYAADLSKEERLDPQKNADAAAMKLGAVWQDGDTLENNVTRMTGPQGQNPADPKALYRNAMAARNQVERESMRTYEGGQAGQGAAANEMIPAFISYFGLQDEEGYTAQQQAMDIILDDPFKASTLYQTITGGEAGVPAWEREATEARTAYDWASAERVIRELGGDTYEQGRQRILDQIDEKKWTAEQAISEFNAWMSAALEAGKRAETVYGEEMKRKTWTTPEEYYPGTEKGGARERFAQKYGVEYTPSPGVPVSQLPNLDEMYGQWHGRMGISEQAPPTQGGWSGQGGQGTGAAAAQAFLEKLMQQHAPQFGAGRA